MQGCGEEWRNFEKRSLDVIGRLFSDGDGAARKAIGRFTLFWGARGAEEYSVIDE